MKIYAIYDNKAKNYQLPWYQPTDVNAVRHFTAEVNRPAYENMLYQFPEDYDLVEMGEVTEEGLLLVNTEPKKLTNGQAVKKETK